MTRLGFGRRLALLRRSVGASLALLAVACSSPALGSLREARAAADSVEQARETLARGRSYKVRLQAANVLGRLRRDPRALQALADAAGADRHPVVRTTAVRLLGRQNGHDPTGGRIRTALFEARSDRHPAVRAAAAKALAELGGRAGGRPAALAHAEPSRGAVDLAPPPPRAAGSRRALAVAVRPIGDRSGRASAAVRDRMRHEIAKNLAREPAVTVADPRSTSLSFVVDGAIKKLELVTRPLEVEAICEVSLVLSRPTRGILLVASGEAIVQRPKLQFRPAQRQQMEAEALMHAVKSAHENLARFLATQ